MPGDILDEFDRQRRGPSYPLVPARIGLLVEDRSSGFCGEIIRVHADAIAVRDRLNAVRQFLFKDGGFLIDGKPVTLVRSAPTPLRSTSPVITASGSIAGGHIGAQRAKASRIWVEGKHDAELVEHVWGDDLRELAIVVEPMNGLDHVLGLVAEFAPGPNRRLGILVDHLVVGSKESRLTQQIRSRHVLVTGHPFVDVWEGVWPRVMGLEQWPTIPRTVPWKQGMSAALGISELEIWPRLRNKVSSFADLRPELVGAVEQLIDFVAEADE